MEVVAVVLWCCGSSCYREELGVVLVVAVLMVPHARCGWEDLMAPVDDECPPYIHWMKEVDATIGHESMLKWGEEVEQ